MQLIGSTTDEATKRKRRKEAIKAKLLDLGAVEDLKAQSQVLQAVISLMETHAGFACMGSSDRLFQEINANIENSMEALEVMLDMMMAMADKLNEYRSNSPSLAQLITSDVKTTLEKNKEQT